MHHEDSSTCKYSQSMHKEPCKVCRFYYEGRLGDAEGSLTVWAPTAQSMELLHYTMCEGGEADVHPMTRGAQGTWAAERPAEWDKHFYLLR
jgi:hypothetical protein